MADTLITLNIYKKINNYYKTLREKIIDNVKNVDISQIDLTYEMSLRAYSENKNLKPYNDIGRALEVIDIIIDEIGCDMLTIICAMLHFTIVNLKKYRKEIIKNHGTKAVKIIQHLRNTNRLIKKLSTSINDSMIDLFSELSSDVRVIIIKLADRLSLMRNIEVYPRYKQIKMVCKTKKIFIPIAHQLGLNNIKCEMENLYLKYALPEDYKKVEFMLNEIKGDKQLITNKFIRQLTRILKNNDVPYRIEKRIKSIYSIWAKITLKNVRFEEIYDIIAIRVIITNEEVDKALKFCWQTYQLANLLGLPKLNRVRDWISRPKPNGYQCLHSTLKNKDGNWIEIQIRTEKMDLICNKGCAAHWIYKKNDNTLYNPYIEKWAENMQELVAEKNATF